MATRQSSGKENNAKSKSSRSRDQQQTTSRSKSSSNKASQDSQVRVAKATSSGKKKTVTYRGEEFEGYNKPKLTPDHPSKKAAVLAKVDGTVKLIRFGQQGYGHNYSEEARKSYLARSKKQSGANDKLSANYWARKFLWAGKGGATQQPQ